MESDIPRYDLTVDYIVGEGFGINLLNGYKNFHCKIEAGFFILCVKGTIQATINGERYNIVENDLITLPPNYFISVHRKYKSDEVHPASASDNSRKSGYQFVSIASL